MLLTQGLQNITNITRTKIIRITVQRKLMYVYSLVQQKSAIRQTTKVFVIFEDFVLSRAVQFRSLLGKY